MILPIQGYSRQSFTAKKAEDFRLPIKGIIHSVDGYILGKTPFNGYRVYLNSRAEEYYNSFQKATSMKEKLFWLEKLGFPDDIVSFNIEKTRKNLKYV